MRHALLIALHSVLQVFVFSYYFVRKLFDQFGCLIKKLAVQAFGQRAKDQDAANKLRRKGMLLPQLPLWQRHSMHNSYPTQHVTHGKLILLHARFITPCNQPITPCNILITPCNKKKPGAMHLRPHATKAGTPYEHHMKHMRHLQCSASQMIYHCWYTVTKHMPFWSDACFQQSRHILLRDVTVRYYKHQMMCFCLFTMRACTELRSLHPLNLVMLTALIMLQLVLVTRLQPECCHTTVLVVMQRMSALRDSTVSNSCGCTTH